MTTKNATFNASDIYKYLTVGTRSNSGDIYYYFKDETPKEITERWQELTGEYNDYNFVDLDEYYRILSTLVDTINGHEIFTEDDLYSIDWPDVYNQDRLNWLSENLNRAYNFEEIKNNGADGIFELIGDMQDFSRGQFASYVYYNFLTKVGEV